MSHPLQKIFMQREYFELLLGKDAILLKSQIRRQPKRIQIDSVPSTELDSVTTIPLKIHHETLEIIQKDIEHCIRCKLSRARTNIVFGEGNPNAELMFVGEGPGEQEDFQGRPFVGVAGQLLDKIISAMGYSRPEVFIANIVKCRPPGNRAPEPDEVEKCLPFLERQIESVKPRVIVALGGTALKSLFKKEDLKITKCRGQWLEYKKIKVMPTFHPSFLLRNPDSKKDVWEDMKMVVSELKSNS